MPAQARHASAHSETSISQVQRQTGSRKKAIVAMARRLGIILWRISLSGQPYQPKPVGVCAEQGKSQPGLPDNRAGKKKGMPANRRGHPLSVQTSG